MTSKCTYVFQQGSKKGKKCKVTCRGDFCFKHKPKTFEYKKRYYREQCLGKYEVEYVSIKELIDKGDIPHDSPWYAILNRKNSMRNDLVDLHKKRQGILLVLRKTTIDEIESKLDKIVNNKYYNDREKSIAKYPKDEQEREREIYDVNYANFKRLCYEPYTGNFKRAETILAKLDKDIQETKGNWVILCKICRMIQQAQNKQLVEV